MILGRLIAACRLAYRERRYRAGAVLTRFIAPDIRREVEIVDASDIRDGFVVARVRTWNVLHAIKGVAPATSLGRPQRVLIDRLWRWEGAPWGGPIPDEAKFPKA